MNSQRTYRVGWPALAVVLSHFLGPMAHGLMARNACSAVSYPVLFGSGPICH